MRPDDSPQREQQHGSLSHTVPMESDFIVSASTSFAPSAFVLDLRSSVRTAVPITASSLERNQGSLAHIPRPLHDEEAGRYTSTTAAINREKGTNHNTTGSVATNADAVVVVDRVKKPHSGATSTSTMSITSRASVSAASHSSSRNAHPRILVPLSQQPEVLEEGKEEKEMKREEEVLRNVTAPGPRTAMSPISAAGRRANVADVTARVQRMRMRGRRAPEVSLASTYTSETSSEQGSPRGSNLFTLSTLCGISLPQSYAEPLKRKK
ncbi:hypothetical protein N2W54_005415 [Lotmaria passim]